MLGVWLGAYINGRDLWMNWVLRELVEPFGLIECVNWGDSWDGDVKREHGLYLRVCAVAVYVHIKNV